MINMTQVQDVTAVDEKAVVPGQPVAPEAGLLAPEAIAQELDPQLVARLAAQASLGSFVNAVVSCLDKLKVSFDRKGSGLSKTAIVQFGRRSQGEGYRITPQDHCCC
jgi:hypothetical protein